MDLAIPILFFLVCGVNFATEQPAHRAAPLRSSYSATESGYGGADVGHIDGTRRRGNQPQLADAFRFSRQPQRYNSLRATGRLYFQPYATNRWASNRPRGLRG